MSDAITRGVRVHVEPRYHPERSQPERDYWFFSYTVTVSNHGDHTVQLIARHWIITDAEGEVQHVRGDGVVGEQPILAPGEAFSYTSACPLSTSLGAMEGSYQMVVRAGDGDSVRFDAVIAPFSLADPATLN
jgi:ApaG protein